MVRPGRRRHVDRSRWRQFHTVAEHFAEAAEIAREFEYWNAAGVLLVHAAIALTDSLTVLGKPPSRCIGRHVAQY